jgi:hypothetical protein
MSLKLVTGSAPSPEAPATAALNRRMTREQFRKHLDMMLPPDKQHPDRYSMAQWWEHYRVQLKETKAKEVAQ